MKQKILFIFLSCYQIINSTYAQTTVWAKTDPFPSYVGAASNIVTDHIGNVIVTGHYNGMSYIKKYDTNGAVLWAKSFVTAASIATISTDEQNNVYAVISTCGTCNLIIDGQNYNGGAIVKYNPQGVLQWAYHPRHSTCLGKKFSSDSTLIVSGWFQDTVTLHGNVFMQTTNPNGCYFIAKMDTDGNFLWAIQDEAGGRINQYTENAFFVKGYIYLTSLPIGKGSKQVTLYSSNGMSYCAKYNNIGDLIWVKQLQFSLIAPDEFGNAYTLEYDNNYPNTSFITKYDTIGNLLWKRTSIYTNGSCRIQMQCGANGDIYMSGGFTNSLTIDSTLITGGSAYKMFLAKLDSSGTLKWITTSSGSGSGWAGANDITVFGNEIFIFGAMGGQNTFGNYTLNEPNGVFTLKITDDEMLSTFVNDKTSVTNGLTVYPNPSNQIITVLFSKRYARQLQLSIKNQLGQVVYSFTSNDVQGKFIKDIDLGKQTKGVYFLEVIADEERLVKKVLLE